MNATQRKKLSKDDLMSLLNTQIGQPALLPETTLTNIIKDTIEKSINEKIPQNIVELMNEIEDNYNNKIEELENDNC